MAGKSKKYWEAKWDKSTGKEDLDKAFDLLLAYTKNFTHKRTFIFDEGWGKFLRFITGAWNRHHAVPVEKAMKPFFGSMPWAEGVNDNLKSLLKGIQRELQQVLTHNPSKKTENLLRRDGDLFKILEVIEEKSKVQVIDFDLLARQEVQTGISPK